MLPKVLYTARFVRHFGWGAGPVLAFVLEDLPDRWLVERVRDASRYDEVPEILLKAEWRRE